MYSKKLIKKIEEVLQKNGYDSFDIDRCLLISKEREFNLNNKTIGDIVVALREENPKEVYLNLPNSKKYKIKKDKLILKK
jgi:hypothetical protein